MLENICIDSSIDCNSPSSYLKSTFLILFSSIFSTAVISQDILKIEGIVVNMHDSTQALPYTKIFSDTTLIAETDINGKFSLKLTDKPALLKFDFDWFIPREIRFDSSGSYTIKLKPYLIFTRHFYDSQKIIFGPSYQFQNKAFGGNLHFSTPYINDRTLITLNFKIYSSSSNYNFTRITTGVDYLFKHRYPYYLPNFELGFMRVSSEKFKIDESSLLFTDLNFDLPLRFYLGIQKISYSHNSTNLELFGFSGGLERYFSNIRSYVHLNTNIYDGLTTYYATVETGIKTFQKYSNNLSSIISVRKIDKYLEISAGIKFSITYRKSYDALYKELNSY